MMKHMKLGALAKILHLAVLTAAGFLESRSSIVAGGGSLVSFKGGNGTSIKAAVRIVGATNILEAVRAQDHWLSKEYPGYRLREFTSPAATRHAINNDRIGVVSQEGLNRTIYFEIAEDNFAAEGVSSIWTAFVAELSTPKPNLLILAHAGTVQKFITRSAARDVVPFMIKQLENTQT